MLNQHIQWFRNWALGNLRGRPSDFHETDIPGRGNVTSQGLSLTNKLTFLAILVVLQICAHAFVAYRLSTKYSVHVSSIIAHIVTFVFFTFKLLLVLQDAYSENFIMDAITKKKVTRIHTSHRKEVSHVKTHSDKCYSKSK